MNIKFKTYSFNQILQLCGFIIGDNFLFTSNFKKLCFSSFVLDYKTKELIIKDNKQKDDLLFILETLLYIAVSDVDNGGRIKTISPDFKRILHYLYEKIDK